VFPKAKAFDRVCNPIVGVEPKFTQSRPAQGLNQQPEHVCYRGIRMNTVCPSQRFDRKFLNDCGERGEVGLKFRGHHDGLGSISSRPGLEWLTAECGSEVPKKRIMNRMS
jgi:hypothetical protein